MSIYGLDYLRLSKEDDKEGESGSISNQRRIIQQYCKSHGVILIREFVDDDYSGGNFNRPGFRAMIDFIESGQQIDVVITKDLSRLGRDMSESSYYAERYFPEHGIRYLAIDDGFDSDKENALAPFQFAMNDMYIRDASKKVKNALHVLMSNGEYCFKAPYGYKKDPENNHRLIPDERTAPVVCDIFSMAGDGKSAVAIAKHLTERGVKPPLKYRVDYLEGERSGNAKYASDTWNSTTVRRILHNPVYLGSTVLGKSKKVSPKSDVKRKIPSDQWKVTENTHQALVDASACDMASRNLARRSMDYRQYGHVRKSIFGGVVYCATCGAAMCSSGSVYKGEREKYWYLSCQNIPARSKRRCSCGARIKYDVLLDVVTRDLRDLIYLDTEQKRSLVDRLIQREKSCGRAAEIERRSSEAETRIGKIETILSKIYEDMYSDAIPRERAMVMIEKYDAEIESLKKSICEYTSQLSGLRSMRSNYDRFFSLVDSVSEFQTLDRTVLLKLIDRIEVSPKQYDDGKQHGARSKAPFSQEVKIFYKFIGQGDFSQQKSS